MDQVTRYYIGTGKTGAMYTLRVEGFTRDRYGYLRETSYYVKTLTTDWEESIARAKKYLRDDVSLLDLSAQPVLRQITREKADHSIIKFGKYLGTTITEVSKVDRPYLVWASKNIDSPRHAKTIELIKKEVEQDLINEKQALIEREAEKVKEATKEMERVLNLKHVGKVKDRIELTLTYTGNYVYDSLYGEGIIHFFTDKGGNELVWKTTNSLIAEDWTRAEKGDTIVLKATIKSHGTYRGRKQTNLTRAKVLKVVKK